MSPESVLVSIETRDNTSYHIRVTAWGDELAHGSGFVGVGFTTEPAPGQDELLLTCRKHASRSSYGVQETDVFWFEREGRGHRLPVEKNAK